MPRSKKIRDNNYNSDYDYDILIEKSKSLLMNYNKNSQQLNQIKKEEDKNLNFFLTGNTLQEQNFIKKIDDEYKKQKEILISKVVPSIQSKFNKMNDAQKIKFYLEYLNLCKIYIKKFNETDIDFSKTFNEQLTKFEKYQKIMNKILNDYYKNLSIIYDEDYPFIIVIYTYFIEFYLCNHFFKVVNFEDLINVKEKNNMTTKLENIIIEFNKKNFNYCSYDELSFENFES